MLLWRLCAFRLSCVWLFPTPWTPARLLCPWDSSGKNTGTGGHFLLRGIFPTQGRCLAQPMSLSSLQLAGRFFTTVSSGKLLQASKPKSYFLFLKQPVWPHIKFRSQDSFFTRLPQPFIIHADFVLFLFPLSHSGIINHLTFLSYFSHSCFFSPLLFLSSFNDM